MSAPSGDGAIEGLTIVHEDARIVVVDKPAGLLSQPGRTLSDSVVERVRAARPRARGPMMMHRLDMDTSGLLVLAKDAEAHRLLGMQFERREVHKRYRARLVRAPSGLGGRIALPLRLDPEDRPRQIVCLRDGRPSVTLWRLAGRDARAEAGEGTGDGLDDGGGDGLGAGGGAGTADDPDGAVDVEFLPLSGRTHQLRVHAADPRGLGAPIVGDRLYGREGGRLMLHAEYLAFTHPDGTHRQVCRSPARFAR